MKTVPKVSAYLARDRIFVDLAPGDRDEVLKEFIDRVAEADGISADRATTILRGVLKRERMGTTGVGRGIAIPHCKTSAVERPMVAFAKLAEPIPYGASDGAPVHSLFLVVSPLEANEEHIEILKWIARLARSDYHTAILRNTADAGSLYDFFRETDEAS